MASGHDPAKLLRWIIKETAVPNYANNPQSESNNNDDNNNVQPTENKDNIPVTHLADLDAAERTKWTNIILGQTPDILNNRNSLKQAIEQLQEIQSQLIDKNEEIKVCLSIIHHLLDKNEAVLAKLNGIPLLLQLITNSMDIDNEICLDSCTILHDASQNNPSMQNHIYSHNGMQIILNALKKCHKYNYKIRAKLWALIHVISRLHNPNFNIFLTHSGHNEINRILRIEQNNINEDFLKEILRVSRLINYMLGAWSDGNEHVFGILNIFGSVNWSIYSLHCYVIKLVSISNVDTQSITNRLRIAQLVLDILMELVGGIRLFMKRNDKCQKFVIRNKNNRDIVSKLESLQTDLGAYCGAHKPDLRLEVKTKNGQPYKYAYYKILNDDESESKCDGDGDDNIYFAMKDIWNTINSILRHVKRYRDHCKRQEIERELWRKTTKKGKQYTKKMKLIRQKKLNCSAQPSVSPPPMSMRNQLVLFDKNKHRHKSKKNKQHKRKRKHK